MEQGAVEAHHDDRPRRSLTSVPWSVGAATLFVFAMATVTIVAAFGADFLRQLKLTTDALSLALTVVLGGAYLVVLGGAWGAARIAGSSFRPAFGLRPTPKVFIVVGAIFATVTGRVAAGAWGWVIDRYELQVIGKDIDPSTIFPPTILGIAMTVLVAGIIAPIAEEVVFRGVLLSALDRRWGAWAAVILSSVIFSLMHVTPFSIPPILVFGLVLGCLFVWTRSLTVCIVAHAVFNLSGIVAIYLLKSAGYL